MKSNNPLVSIMIPNYNHGKFLDQCIQSALKQTYDNIEIVVLDNCSEDDSIEVIKKYTKDGVRLFKNLTNIFSNSFEVISELTSGKYKMLLCADDCILPEFVQKAVSIMEEHPNVGYVHCEKDFINEDGDIIPLDPFYNCSFIVSGNEVMPIYLLTPVAFPNQGVFRTSCFESINGYNQIICFANADRTLWFYLSTVGDYAYIKEKLALYRIHSSSASFRSTQNLYGPIFDYLSIYNLIEYSKLKNYTNVLARADEAYKKIAGFCLSYIASLLKKSNFKTANEFLLFCKLFDPEIEKNDYYIKLKSIQETEAVDIEYLDNKAQDGYDRKRSYEPPKGYQRIDI